MIILEAAEHGMCFGVRDALAILDRTADPTAVTIHGELVHNGEVLRELDRRGFRRTAEAERPLPATPTVMVTAHGISERERHRLTAAGKVLVDTTCPLVQKAHEAAQALQQEGRRVIVIGRPGHVEVRGIVEDLDRPIVVGAPGDVTTWPERRLGVLCQTTTRAATAVAIVAAIRAANPHADVCYRDTICSPTKARVQALDDLLPRIDGLVVVGGIDSNNTRQLAMTATNAGVDAIRIESADQLNPSWLHGRRVVGLTAGTSTPDRTIAAVRDRLRWLAGSRPTLPADRGGVPDKEA
ncbi:MAG: 4-hydroxy-3-methylbut-2-enyl diphosphate reductase [Planctomycetes bacterium]|nr:4-hydroxy-3-methylbut-2-enyl diphosphate reductase [Planctomycetota bacterium]